MELRRMEQRGIEKERKTNERKKRTSVLIAFHSFYICLFVQFRIMTASSANGKSANNITSVVMEKKYNTISQIFVLMCTTRQVYLLLLFASLVSIKMIVIYFKKLCSVCCLKKTGSQQKRTTAPSAIVVRGIFKKK